MVCLERDESDESSLMREMRAHEERGKHKRYSTVYILAVDPPTALSHIIAARIGYIPSQKSAKQAPHRVVFLTQTGDPSAVAQHQEGKATPLAAGTPPRKGIPTSTVGCYVDLRLSLYHR